jgi:hypothetical protein
MNQSILRKIVKTCNVTILHFVIDEIQKNPTGKGEDTKRNHGLRNGLQSRKDLTIGANNRQENLIREGDFKIHSIESE